MRAYVNKQFGVACLWTALFNWSTVVYFWIAEDRLAMFEWVELLLLT